MVVGDSSVLAHFDVYAVHYDSGDVLDVLRVLSVLVGFCVTVCVIQMIKALLGIYCMLGILPLFDGQLLPMAHDAHVHHV